MLPPILSILDYLPGGGIGEVGIKYLTRRHATKHHQNNPPQPADMPPNTTQNNPPQPADMPPNTTQNNPPQHSTTSRQLVY